MGPVLKNGTISLLEQNKRQGISGEESALVRLYAILVMRWPDVQDLTHVRIIMNKVRLMIAYGSREARRSGMLLLNAVLDLGYDVFSGGEQGRAQLPAGVNSHIESHDCIDSVLALSAVLTLSEGEHNKTHGLAVSPYLLDGLAAALNRSSVDSCNALSVSLAARIARNIALVR